MPAARGAKPHLVLPRLHIATHLRAADDPPTRREAAARASVERNRRDNGARASRAGSSASDQEIALRDFAYGLVSDAIEPSKALHGMTPIQETSFHDFAEYRFMRDPDLFASGNTTASIAGTVSELLSVALTGIIDFVDALPRIGIVGGHVMDAIVERLYTAFKANAANPLYEFAATIQPGYPGTSGSVVKDVVGVFMISLRGVMPTTLQASSAEDKTWERYGRWAAALNDAIVSQGPNMPSRFFATFPTATRSTGVSPPPTDYSFQPFPTIIVNLGLRVIFRQEWRPLGTQPGEIVRTIPLAPKQVVKVSTRVVSTDKISRTDETSTTTETTSETASTTKDSSDVVREASSKMNWHLDAEASGGFLGFSFGVKAGMARESASASKDAKSRLNETMQKTASRMTRNTKVVVSVEQSTTTESTSASEISNPNEELAVTYVYSKLQRQYEIATSLAEVNSVVFIPEPLPRYDEIDEVWIRRHDWILARALLDASFAEDLALVSRHVPEKPIPGAELTGFADGASKARGAIDAYKSYQGGDSLGFISSTHDAYERLLDKQRAQTAAAEQWTRRSQRLIQHIRDNILHYMRAIWGAEDADQRLRRYARLSVPTLWTFVPFGSVPIPAEGGSFATGEFVPDLSADSLRPVTDLINPAGPIGYVANYAVFFLKSDVARRAEIADPSRIHVDHVLAIMRSAYAASEVRATGGPRVRSAVVQLSRHDVAEYSLVRTNPASWTAELIVAGQPYAVPATGTDDDLGVAFDGIKLLFEQAPPLGLAMRVFVRATDRLEDPELRDLRDRRPLPKTEDEKDFFTPAVLADMASYLPEVDAALRKGDEPRPPLVTDWSKLDEKTRALVRGVYHEYLVVKGHTQKLLLETNNLVVDIDVGTTPILEDFKRLHRGIDVLKEVEEAIRRRLDNARRDARLAQNDLEDPDVESVTMVTVPQAPTTVSPVVVGGGTNR